MAKIRICKGSEIGRKSFAIGLKNKEWTGKDGQNPDGWYRVNLPETKMFIEIEDGLIRTGTGPDAIVEDKEGNPVSAENIVKQLVKDNRETRVVTASGYSLSHHYGETNKWFVDYEPSLKPLFKELKLPIPADGQSLAARMQSMAMGNLAAMGFAKNEMGGYDNVAPGQKALDDAKAKAKAEVMAEKDAEIEALKAQLAEKETKVKKKETVSV